MSPTAPAIVGKGQGRGWRRGAELGRGCQKYVYKDVKKARQEKQAQYISK